MRSRSSERSTASIGIAKPTPLPSPLSDSICELMPITRPRASTSGPPELPWLIAASVWMTPVIEKAPLSESIVRSVAEMMPTVSDCSSPNGLPIAATGAPTSSRALEPSASGRSVSPFGSIRSSATSSLGSKPTIFALTWLPSWSLT